MSFDYDEIKKGEEGGSHWATYSDLFMVLSLVFLLLYVVASVRSGTSHVKSHAEYQKIVRERDALLEEIRVYNTMKDDYLSRSNQSEQANYEELMSKLDLLQEDAKREKDELRQAAEENEKKEIALNKYQRMIRNIINSNILSSVSIERRNQTIKKNFKTIDQQQGQIQDLESTVVRKQKEIKKINGKITRLNSSLTQKIKQLRKSYKQRKISKKKMQAQVKRLKMANSQRIKKLKQKNQVAAQIIEQSKEKIERVSQNLAQAERTIASQKSDIATLVSEKHDVTQKISNLRQSFQAKMAKEKQAFQSKLQKQQLSARAKAAQQKEFQKQVQQREARLANEIQKMESKAQDLQGRLEQTQQAQAQAEAKSQALASQNANLKGQRQQLSSDLKRMKELANAKKKLIDDMKKNLQRSGLKAQVDEKSGEVVIEFGDEYFDTGKANVKPGMERVLKKFMPAYSKTLFSDKKAASQIKSIEIIGYASPTYQGKYVNPVSLTADNKEAVNYNLDLSYYRARSIFDYIFDTEKMRYPHQEDILPMVKVTGRSFLAEGVDKRQVANMSHKQYCKKFDCKKSQRVVIKFNMEN